ncbi:MAG: ABC transporter permease [Gemmatimonadota bacterium]|nr:ABC transporter permease [Gemmatimonadota bacterium]
MMTRLGLLVRLALRNLRRQARRSVLTASAMVLGLALLVFTRSIGDGAHETWIKAGVRLASGHVTVVAPDYLPRRTIEDRLRAAGARAALDALARSDLAPLVEIAAPRLELRALASSPRGAVPVVVYGVDPTLEPAFSQLTTRLVEGRALLASDRLHAYVGVGLAQRLHLRLGDRVVLTAQGADSTIADQLVRVAGTFRSGLPEVDDGVIHIPIATAQAWVGVGDDVSAVAILLHSSRDADRVVRSLTAALGTDGTAVALPWPTTTPELDSAVKLDDYGNYVFHFVLLLIVALAIVNTILMAVLARTRELGILRALGLRRRDTATLVLFEGTLLTTVAGLLGAALGLAVTFGIFRDGLDFSAFYSGEMTAAGAIIDLIMIPEFRLDHMLQNVVWIFIIGVVASLYPAWRATRIEIAEAMKFEG